MFKTLDDLKEKKEQDKKDKKNTNSYVGGEKSGLAVENPDDLQAIIEKAKKNTQQQQQSGQRLETQIKITLYSNGFTLNDDGEFRDYNLPENKQFMKEINQQQVPIELRKKYPQGLDVSLEDKRSEVFKIPPPPSYIAFSGQGVSLGANQQQQQVLTQQIQQPNLKKGQINVDENKPTTNIKLRFHNGTAINVRINVDDTIQTLYDYTNS
ncbi:nsfl1 cofactor p47, putative, partial [Ichthyophthirius multifiliis]